MPNFQNIAQQLNAALDQIGAVANDPQQVHQAIEAAKQKIAAWVNEQQSNPQGQDQGQTQGQGQEQKPQR
jgi:ABC-type transporter Mla subunit MlaD